MRRSSPSASQFVREPPSRARESIHRRWSALRVAKRSPSPRRAATGRTARRSLRERRLRLRDLHRAGLRDTKGPSLHRSGWQRSCEKHSLFCSTPGFRRHACFASTQCIAQLMPRPKQKNSYKWPADAQRVRNLFVAHIGVIAQNERHPGTIGQASQTRAHCLAGMFVLQTLELAGIGVLKRKRFQVAGFEVLADAATAQRIPAVVARHFVKPRGERPRGIVRADLLSHLHENLRRRVFRILTCRQQAPAKAEDCRSVLPIQLAPSLCITRPNLGQQSRQIGFAHSPGRLLPFHWLIRRPAPGYYKSMTRKELRYSPGSGRALARYTGVDTRRG